MDLLRVRFVDCSRSTFQVSKGSGFYPRVRVDGKGRGVVSQAGGVLLARTVRATGLDEALSMALSGWRKPFAVHDPAKVVLDLAVAVALGGDALADIAVVRSEPAVFGLVASDATVSRTIDALAADAPAALRAIAAARAMARERAWRLAGDASPSAGIDGRHPLVIDLDATLVTAHSDKELAAPTFKRGFGHHPLWAFADHGPQGTGEPLAVALRAGNAGSNTAADHITVIRDALRQLPSHPSNRASTPGSRSNGAARKIEAKASWSRSSTFASTSAITQDSNGDRPGFEDSPGEPTWR